MANNHELNEIFKVQIYFSIVWKINIFCIFGLYFFLWQSDVYFVYEYI